MSAQPLRVPPLALQEVEPPESDASVTIGDVLARRRIGSVPVMSEPVAVVDDRRLHAVAVVPAAAPATAALEGNDVRQESVPRRARWVRNMLLGASLSFADAGVIALNPVGFVWKNAHTIALAGIYLLMPLLASLFLLDAFPVLAEFCKTETVVGMLYFAGLYLSSAALLMLGAFTTGFLGRGALRLMDHFARRGEEAFPKH